MAMFRFGLQSVAQMRQRERDTAAGSYREALAAKEKLQELIDQMLKEHAEQRSQQSSDAAGGQINTQRIIESQRYQVYLLSQIEHLRSQLALIDAECEKRRLVLVKREQALSSLEKLREKQLNDWKNEQDLKEQSALDQWAGFKYWNDSR